MIKPYFVNIRNESILGNSDSKEELFDSCIADGTELHEPSSFNALVLYIKYMLTV